VSTAQLVVSLVGPGGRGWRRPCWASGSVGLDLAVVVGGGWAVARSIAWPTGRGRMRARVAPLVGEPGCAARRLRYVVIVAAEGRVARSLRASWAGLRLELAAVLRPHMQ
jgi:hypothetical protein